MEAVLEKIIKSPKLELYYKEIENIIIEEHKKREDFYKIVKDSDKKDFEIPIQSIFNEEENFKNIKVNIIIINLRRINKCHTFLLRSL